RRSDPLRPCGADAAGGGEGRARGARPPPREAHRARRDGDQGGRGSRLRLLLDGVRVRDLRALVGDGHSVSGAAPYPAALVATARALAVDRVTGEVVA